MTYSEPPTAVVFFPRNAELWGRRERRRHEQQLPCLRQLVQGHRLHAPEQAGQGTAGFDQSCASWPCIEARTARRTHPGAQPGAAVSDGAPPGACPYGKTAS